MPDPTRKTISATQAAALWNVSPYVTRWMLWRHFRDGLTIEEAAPHSRMVWGSRMQPLLLTAAAEDLAMEVRPNDDDTYIRRGRFGCTRDAEIIVPDQGPAALETKCVFDYRRWMEEWAGGEAPPKHYEIQLQVQMYVGDGERPFDRGTIAAWVCGEMVYFDREPLPDLWAALDEEAERFFASLADGDEPEPFGSVVEVPALMALERIPGKVVDLTGRDDEVEIAEKVRSFDLDRRSIRFNQKSADVLKAELLALMGDAEEAECFGGIRLRVARSGRGLTLKPFIPDHLPDVLLDLAARADLGG